MIRLTLLNTEIVRRELANFERMLTAWGLSIVERNTDERNKHIELCIDTPNSSAIDLVSMLCRSRFQANCLEHKLVAIKAEN